MVVHPSWAVRRHGAVRAPRRGLHDAAQRRPDAGTWGGGHAHPKHQHAHSDVRPHTGRLAGTSPSPSRVAVAASPSPAGGAQSAADADVAAVQRRMEQIIATPDLRGIEALLLDHVSFSTPQGGDVLDNAVAATWLRDHAGPGIKMTRLERGTQEVMLQVQTDGWPTRDPVQQGLVNFGLRRYDANGRQDETGNGDWKIDVISVE